MSGTDAYPAQSQGRSGCVEFRGEARYRNYAYDHIVILESLCDKRMLCDVSTNVNPNPIRVSIHPRESLEVTTFRGSPAREFTATVHCEAPSAESQRGLATCSAN